MLISKLFNVKTFAGTPVDVIHQARATAYRYGLLQDEERLKGSF